LSEKNAGARFKTAWSNLCQTDLLDTASSSFDDEVRDRDAERVDVDIVKGGL